MDFYQTLLTALGEEERVILATIVSSAGSTPLPAGAKMLLSRSATVPAGTVGGGSLESAVISEAQKLFASGGTSKLLTITLEDESSEGGMICGGSVEVFIETLTSDSLPFFVQLASRRENGEDSLLVTTIDRQQAMCSKKLCAHEKDLWAEVGGIITGGTSFPAPPTEALAEAHGRQHVVRHAFPGGEHIVESVPGAPALVIFGGGHVSRFVSQSAAMAGFLVTVVDERKEFANPSRFPEARQTLAVPFAQAWDALHIHPSTSIVIVTRGHRLDEEVLEQAVRTSARYIGMIGSARKVLATFRHLRERGVPDRLLERVRAPIGLDIGALTAEEIGVAITAELISVRRGKTEQIPPMSARVDRTSFR